jgi:CubicO group peptidase (beta-lactamase class C family)
VAPLDFTRAAAVIEHGHASHAYPAAVVEVGNTAGVLWRQAFGRLSYAEESSPASVETVFDLASLTKVLATTTLAMRLLDGGAITLSDRVTRWIPEWQGRDRQDVTLRALLSHSSGLTAWLPFFRDHTGRAEFQHAICSLPLEYTPDTQSIYSDLGFILLAFALEDAGGARFDAQVIGALKTLTSSPLLFNPPAAVRSKSAPTEIDPWRGRLLVGEVHDENCWALGGAAGHAGLFGTAQAVGDVARAMLSSVRDGAEAVARPATVRTFVARAGVPGSRALGWDTMLPTSSCGTKMSATAFGHTGFTGTSLWIDPQADAYVVFLSNRVNPTRENTAIQQIRPSLHDAVMTAIGV